MVARFSTAKLKFVVLMAMSNNSARFSEYGPRKPATRPAVIIKMRPEQVGQVTAGRV
jgi:hypothetical protein